MKHLVTILTLVAAGYQTAHATEPGWYLRAHGGLSELSDVSGDATAIDDTSGGVDVSLDTGFTAGLSAGKRLNSHWSVELAWEYRSNDSETEIADTLSFDDGNYAANAFYFNGLYHFSAWGAWEPYIGAGIGWLQEIDIDLEDSRGEQSYSGDGDIGYQLFAGTHYYLSDRWMINAELRYSAFSDLDLEAESRGGGSLSGLDYEPLTAQIGILYRF